MDDPKWRANGCFPLVLCVSKSHTEHWWLQETGVHFWKLAKTYPYLYKTWKSDSHRFFMDIYNSLLYLSSRRLPPPPPPQPRLEGPYWWWLPCAFERASLCWWHCWAAGTAEANRRCSPRWPCRCAGCHPHTARSWLSAAARCRPCA